jgi:hypothetical protein
VNSDLSLDSILNAFSVCVSGYCELNLLRCRHVPPAEPIDLLNVAFEQRVKQSGARQHAYVVQM